MRPPARRARGRPGFRPRRGHPPAGYSAAPAPVVGLRHGQHTRSPADARHYRRDRPAGTGRSGSAATGRGAPRRPADRDPNEPLDVLPVTLGVAGALPGVPRAEIPDMPDRIIAATAVAHGLPLVSADSDIRGSTSLKATVSVIW